MTDFFVEDEKEPIDILKSNLKAIEGFITEDNQIRISHYQKIADLEYQIFKNQRRVEKLKTAIARLED